MPTVAAVVPVFNHGVYLSACLESVFNQSRRFDEVIIVDDRSSDPLTTELLGSLNPPPGVKLFRNPRNMGISATQNKAVALCESEYVAFVDCDDYLSEHANEKILDAVDGAVDYAFSDRMNVNERGEQLRRYRAGDLIARHRFGLSDLLLDQMVASHLKVVRRRTLMELNGFKTEYDGAQDWDLALKIAEFGRMVHVPLPLYFHRVHERQTTSAFRIVNFRRMNEVRRAALERRGLVARKALSAAVRRQAEHAGRLVAATAAADADYRSRWPAGGLVLAFDGGPVRMFSLYERAAADAVKDGAVCLVLPDLLERVSEIRHLGLCRRAFVGLMVFPHPKSIAEAQKQNSYFDFLVHVDGTASCGVAGYGWSGLAEFGAS